MTKRFGKVLILFREGEEVVTVANSRCQFPGCDKIATSLGYDHSDNLVGFYCDIHCREVVGRTRPEHFHECPNCGCTSGVN